MWRDKRKRKKERKNSFLILVARAYVMLALRRDQSYQAKNFNESCFHWNRKQGQDGWQFSLSEAEWPALLHPCSDSKAKLSASWSSAISQSKPDMFAQTTCLMSSLLFCVVCLVKATLLLGSANHKQLQTSRSTHLSRVPFSLLWMCIGLFTVSHMH